VLLSSGRGRGREAPQDHFWATLALVLGVDLEEVVVATSPVSIHGGSDVIDDVVVGWYHRASDTRPGRWRHQY